MIVLGVKLSRPSFGDLTKCAIVATVILTLLATVCLLIGHTPSTRQKVTWVALTVWGSISSACGISISGGWRHIGLYLTVALMLAIGTSAITDVIGQ